jgi:hypothetical protein
MTVRSCGRDDLPDVLMPGLDFARQRADGLGLDELVAVAIEMDELPAGELPAGIGGDGDQGVAAGVIAYREVPDAMARVWTDGSP